MSESARADERETEPAFVSARRAAPGLVGELELHAQSALEWPALLAALAERAASEPGRERLAALTPAATPAAARERTARVQSVLDLNEHGVELHVGAFPDVRETLARIRVDAAISGSELLELRKLLEQAAELRRFTTEHSELAPSLAAWLASDAKLDRLATSLRDSLERDGSVSDAASPALADARAKARETREELKRRLSELSQRYADVLSAQYYTERDGRYVLPVRSDAHYRVEGIVLGSSGSGSTLFVEPSELMSLGNRLRVREAEVERETERVLRELSGKIAQQLPAIQRAFEACIDADVVLALTRFARDTRALPFEVGDEPRFDVRGLRHPLLALTTPDVVANDVELAGGQALVVSGPNAGGKTVVLKSLGLFAWMARAGIPIPAEPGSYIGWFDAVLADIGDEQSLVRSLSTFSAHVQHLSRILDRAAPHVLALLDEVAAGTDPEEGAALAAAVLEALAARGAAVAVTTHYEQLKHLAAEPGALENASMGFDFSKMLPTFRLQQGIPGASSALQVAARHGLPASVLKRAAELLPEDALDRERLVLELSREKAELAKERAEIERLRAEARAEASEHSAQLRSDAAHARAELDRGARQLVQDVQQARIELRKARERLRAERISAQELKSLENEISQVAAQVAIGGRFSAPTERAPEPLQTSAFALELQPGNRVRLRSTGAIATVLEPPNRGEVLLRVGGLRLREKISSLQAAPPSGKQRPVEKPRALKQVSARPAAQRTSANTLDLRGVRVEDAPGLLDGFIDRLMSSGEAAGFVLHGHGTGALRSAVREHLRVCSYVEQPRAADVEDGGDALTTFWLH